MFLIFLSIIALTLTQILTGSFWYSSFMFGNLWAKKKSLDFTKINAKKIKKSYIFAFLTAILKAILLTTTLYYFQFSIFTLSIIIFIMLSFVLLDSLDDIIWGKTNITVFLINFGKTFFSTLISIIIGYIIL